MKKGTVMSQDDLYNAIRHNFGEVVEDGVGNNVLGGSNNVLGGSKNVLGKGMELGINTMPNVISSPNINTTKVTNGKSTVIVKDTEIILSGTRITIEGKATIHLDD